LTHIDLPFSFTAPAPTHSYTLSLHDALPIFLALPAIPRRVECFDISTIQGSETVASMVVCEDGRMRKSDYRKYRISPANHAGSEDRKSTRLNSSHRTISYAGFCLKKKKPTAH